MRPYDVCEYLTEGRKITHEEILFLCDLLTTHHR